MRDNYILDCRIHQQLDYGQLMIACTQGISGKDVVVAEEGEGLRLDPAFLEIIDIPTPNHCLVLLGWCQRTCSLLSLLLLFSFCDVVVVVMLLCCCAAVVSLLIV